MGAYSRQLHLILPVSDITTVANLRYSHIVTFYVFYSAGHTFYGSIYTTAGNILPPPENTQ